MRKLLLALTLAFFLISFAYAEQQSLGTFKRGDCVNLIQTCANCSYVNISSVTYPNSTRAVGQVSMDASGTVYNYTTCKNNATGKYIVNGYGDPDGILEVWVYDYYVTENGQEAPEGITKIFFIILFLIIISFATFSIINCIAHWVSLDCDIFDAGMAMGIYFSVIALYYFSTLYLGNGLIEETLLMFIKIGWLTHIVVPMFAFASSMIWNPLKPK